MENPSQLADRFKEVILDGKWIANTNYRDQLSKVTWEQANRKIGALNTIAALSFHIQYYITGILHFFETGTFKIRDKFSFDAPPIASQEDWDRLLTDLWTNTERLAEHIGQLSEEKLDEIFIDEQYGSYRRNIEGLIEHAYYHLGQISLIRKVIDEQEMGYDIG